MDINLKMDIFDKVLDLVDYCKIISDHYSKDFKQVDTTHIKDFRNLCLYFKKKEDTEKFINILNGSLDGASVYMTNFMEYSLIEEKFKIGTVTKKNKHVFLNFYEVLGQAMKLSGMELKSTSTINETVRYYSKTLMIKLLEVYGSISTDDYEYQEAISIYNAMMGIEGETSNPMLSMFGGLDLGDGVNLPDMISKLQSYVNSGMKDKDGNLLSVKDMIIEITGGNEDTISPSMLQMFESYLQPMMEKVARGDLDAEDLPEPSSLLPS